MRVLKEPLKDGIKILFLASISFDPIHGLALRILDIDPGYTLGDLEREKQETIQRLQEEGVFNKNKLVPFPLLPQRIAIISVDTSKGYIDFLKVIDNNEWNYAFFHVLFPSLLQGEKAIEGIMKQLDRIGKVLHHFDVVAIIRGGGGDIGLSSFNNYSLSKAIALFPIPVITGIGHATNETVSELVSFENSITPTKLGEFIIQKFHNFSVPVQKARERIMDISRRLIVDEEKRFQAEIKLFRSVTGNTLMKNRNAIQQLGQSLIRQSQFRFRNEKQYFVSIKDGMKRNVQNFWTNSRQILNNLEKNVRNMDPKNVLKRGYSITLLNGKAVRNVNEVKKGDHLDTSVFEGNIQSTVTATKKSSDHE
jgi:exodeoxyribonuclease VII large subunit